MENHEQSKSTPEIDEAKLEENLETEMAELFASDEELENLVDEYMSFQSAHSREQLLVNIGISIEEMILGELGLSGLFSQDGGAVQTRHNFMERIGANKEEQERIAGAVYNDAAKKEAESRYNRVRESIKTHHKQTKGEIDDYTGYEVEGRVNVDHIISRKEYMERLDVAYYLTMEERAERVNSPENFAYTSESINKSKGAKPLVVFANAPSSKDPQQTNAEYYGLDPQLLEQVQERAEEKLYNIPVCVIKREEQRRIKRAAKAIGIQMGTAAIRELLANFMRELLPLVISEVQDAMEKHRLQKTSLTDFIKDAFFRVTRKAGMLIKQRKWARLYDALGGALTGLISSIGIAVINMFITTPVLIVSIIKEGLRLCKNSVLLMRDASVPQNEKLYELGKLMAVGITTMAGLALKELFKKMGLPPTVRNLVVGLLTCVLSCLALEFLDRQKERVLLALKRNVAVQAADIQSFQNYAVTLKIVKLAADHHSRIHQRLQEEGELQNEKDQQTAQEAEEIRRKREQTRQQRKDKFNQLSRSEKQ